MNLTWQRAASNMHTGPRTVLRRCRRSLRRQVRRGRRRQVRRSRRRPAHRSLVRHDGCRRRLTRRSLRHRVRRSLLRRRQVRLRAYPVPGGHGAVVPATRGDVLLPRKTEAASGPKGPGIARVAIQHETGVGPGIRLNEGSSTSGDLSRAPTGRWSFCCRRAAGPHAERKFRDRYRWINPEALSYTEDRRFVV